MRKIVFLILVTCMALSSINLSYAESTDLTIYIGEKIDLRDYIQTEGIAFKFNDKTVVQNLNASILTVNSSFVVTTKDMGKGILVLTNSVESITINVSVISPIESVTLKHNYFSLLLGEIQTLDYTVEFKSDAPSSKLVNIKWKSSKPNVATVVNGNEINTKSPGTTILIGETIDGQIIASIDVTVLGHSSKLRISNGGLGKTLNVGDVLSLTAYLGSKNVSQNIRWFSITPHILKVDDKGVITAIGEGRGVVQAETSTGKKVKYELNTSSMIDRVEFNHTVYKFNAIGQTHQLSFNLYPKDKNFPPILNGYSYITSNPSVATVSKTGLITTQGAGIALISVVFDDSQKRASCTVEVPNNDEILAMNYIPVNKISLTPYKRMALIGERIILDYKISPENATDQRVNFNIPYGQNSQIDKIDGRYCFIPSKRGNIKIEVIGADGKTDEITISVTSPIDTLDLSLDTRRIVGTNEEELYIGETAKLLTRIYSRSGYEVSDVFDSSLIYSVKDKSIVNLIREDNEIYIKALRRGNTEIYVTNLEGMHKETLWLSIEDPVASISTDNEILMPLGVNYRPRVNVDIISTVTDLDDSFSLLGAMKLTAKSLYLSEFFIDQEINYEIEKVELYNNPSNTPITVDQLRIHELRLKELEKYKEAMNEGYSFLSHQSLLKDRNGRKYNFYTIEKNQVKSNYPIKILIEIELMGTNYKTETIMTWVDDELFHIKRLNKYYTVGDLINQYGLENALEKVSTIEQIKLLTTYMNNRELFQRIPSHKLLNATKDIFEDENLGHCLKPFDRYVTKADLAKISVCLYKKYVSRLVVLDNKRMQYYDITDDGLESAVALGYVEPRSNFYFGSTDMVSGEMFHHMINKILPMYQSSNYNNAKQITFEEVVLILGELLN